MANVEHVNLVVKDIKETKDFLLAAFPDWRVRGQGQNSWYGDKRNWIHIGTDHSYITLNDMGDGSNRDLKSLNVGLAHIGIVVEDVDELRNRLVSKGYEIGTIGADHPFRKTIYFIDPAGYEFEFIQYLSDKPEEKNMYGGETSDIQRIGTKK